MYNIDELKKKITQLQGNRTDTKDKKDLQRLVWFKPQVNKTYDIRFLNLLDGEGNPLGQPFFEVSYYDNQELTKMRFVSPSQFKMPDPIKEMVLELAPDKTKAAWFLKKKLTPKERYYAAIIVRGGTSDVSGDIKPVPEETVLVWELTPKLCKDVYAILVHPDYQDENLFDNDGGYDFTITVNPTDKLFNGNPVKEIKLQPRRKPNKMCDKKNLEKIMSQVPNFHNYFKAQVKDEEAIKEILEAFLGSKDGEENKDGNGVVRGGLGGSDIDAALADINKQFEDL